MLEQAVELVISALTRKEITDAHKDQLAYQFMLLDDATELERLILAMNYEHIIKAVIAKSHELNKDGDCDTCLCKPLCEPSQMIRPSKKELLSSPDVLFKMLGDMIKRDFKGLLDDDNLPE